MKENVNIRCVIKELNGLTADWVLDKYWQKDELPVNIAKILFTAIPL